MIHGEDKDDAFWHKIHGNRTNDYKKLMCIQYIGSGAGQIDICYERFRGPVCANIQRCFPFNTETIHKGWYDEYIHSSEGTGFLCIYTNNSPILMTSPL